MRLIFKIIGIVFILVEINILHLLTLIYSLYSFYNTMRVEMLSLGYDSVVVKFKSKR